MPGDDVSEELIGGQESELLNATYIGDPEKLIARMRRSNFPQVQAMMVLFDRATERAEKLEKVASEFLAELERLGAENEALAEVADNCRQLTWDPGTGSLGINLEQNVRLKAALDALERIRGVD
jgi:hypothetical protein